MPGLNSAVTAETGWNSLPRNEWYRLTRILQLNPWFEIRGALQYPDLSQAEIGRQVGVNKMRVCRILAREGFNENA
jgi:hypothetical protein